MLFHYLSLISTRKKQELITIKKEIKCFLPLIMKWNVKYFDFPDEKFWNKCISRVFQRILETYITVILLFWKKLHCSRKTVFHRKTLISSKSSYFLLRLLKTNAQSNHTFAIILDYTFFPTSSRFWILWVYFMFKLFLLKHNRKYIWLYKLVSRDK